MYVQQRKVQMGWKSEHKSEGVVINKQSLSQSHHWSHRCGWQRAEPTTVMHDDNIVTNKDRTFRSEFRGQKSSTRPHPENDPIGRLC